MKKFFGMIVLAALAVISTGCGYTAIEPGYVGIKVNYAGSAKGVDQYPVLTGWQSYTPGRESIVKFPTFVQNIVWTHNVGEGNPVNEEITFSNMDQMQIAVDVSLAYQLDPAKVSYFYQTFKTSDLDNFSNNFLHNAARNTFDKIGGRYHIEQIMGDNAKFLAEVQDAFQKEVDPFGVKIIQFGLVGIPRPPQAVIEAINAKVHAQQLAQQKENELNQVDADMRKEKSKAETYSANTLLYAQRSAEGNRVIAASITPTLVDYMKAQAALKWDGKMPDTITGGVVPFINVGSK